MNDPSTSFKTAIEAVGRWLVKLVAFSLLTVFLFSTLLSFLKWGMSKHWAWGISIIVLFGVMVFLGLKDLRNRRLETGQGIRVFILIVMLTISMFSVLSFIFYRFGRAHYEGFSTQSTNEALSTTINFMGFYTWQFFDLIPGLRINEALGWQSPLVKSGFVSGLLALGFRATMIFILLKEFRTWWVNRADTGTRYQPADAGSKRGTERGPEAIDIVRISGQDP